MDDVSSLQLKVDSTQVKAAEQNLKSFAAAGTVAETAATGLERSALSAADALSATSRGAGAANAAQAALGKNSKSAGDAIKHQGESTKLTGYQTAQLSAQLQDLFVQIQAGGSPVTALIQQGSQLSAVFGGFKGAFSAVASIFTVTRVAALGLAAGVGLVVAGFVRGSDQSKELARTLILTGNAAGLTEARFNTMAQAIADGTRTTIGSTRDTLQALASTGRFSGDTLNEAATATQLLAKVTGQSSDDIVKSFAQAADGVTRYSVDLNRTYNFLSASQLEQIRVLEEQGRSSEALQIVLGSLNQRLREATGQTTLWSEAFQGLKRGVSDAIEQLDKIGRTKGPADRIADITAQLDLLKKAGQSAPLVFGPSADQLQQELAQLKAKVKLQDDLAKKARDTAEREQAGVQFNALIEQSKSQQAKYADAIRKAAQLAAQSGAKPEQIEAVTLALQRQYGFLARLRELQDIRITVQTGQVDRQFQGVADAFQNANADLEQQRQQFLISDRNYYATKGLLLRQSADAEVRQLEASNRIERSRKVIAEDDVDAARQRAEISERIANNDARIAIIRADASAKQQFLNRDEVESVKSLDRAFQETQISAQLYIETLKRAGSREVSAVGLGDVERQRVEGLTAINEKFESRREQLDAELANGRLRGKRNQYERELALLRESQDEEVAIYRGTFDKVQAAQGDWVNGAARAFANYRDAAKNVADETDKLFTDAFKGVEDSLVKFVMTGKLNFKDLANSIIADIIRIQIRRELLKALDSAKGGGFGDFISSIFGGGGYNGNTTGPVDGFGGAFANGGTLGAGKWGIAGERGPEIVKGPAQIVSNGATRAAVGAAGRGMTVVQNFTVSGSTDRSSQAQIATMAGQGIQRAMNRNS